VDIARNLLEIRIRINEEGLIASLIEMARPFVGAIEVRGIRDVEVAHEFLEIGPRGLDQQMKMIGHQDVGQHLHLVDLGGADQELQKDRMVQILGVDLLTGIAPAGNMVIGVLELDAEGTGHGGEGSRGRERKSRIKI